MMATNAPTHLIEQVAATLSERIYLANYNAPDQTVVGGRVDMLKQLAELLNADGYKSQIIGVPCPFHTPLMAGSGEILKQTLDTLRMRSPRVPFISSVTNRYVGEPSDIRANLAAQLTTPVRYVELINRIAGEQQTVFVEVGPQQALTKLNRRILEGQGVAGVIACDNPKHGGAEQLYNVRAMLECLAMFDDQAASRPSPSEPVSVQPASPGQPAPAAARHDRALRRHAAADRKDASRRCR